jgi:iron(III) transport system ATP-binding protein
MSLLSVQGITKHFHRSARPAVSSASFTVSAGELAALAGESGSGKTTLLRMISGLERPDEGTIALDGRVLSTPAFVEEPERRGIGLVFQDHALFPHLTVSENIAFGLNRRTRAERREIIGAMLELVGLPGYELRYPHELSGGERQRIALARSLAPSPRLLLLDEPFSSLDTRLRQEVRDHTRAVLKSHGTAGLMVTHDVQDALSIADRIVLLRHGVIQQDSEPREIYQAPANEYVATFFGSCNFLPAGVLPQEGSRVIGPPEGAGAGAWIRPEDLRLLPETAAHAGDLVGTVEQAAFCGDWQDVRLRCIPPAGGEPFLILVHAHPNSRISPGERWTIVPRESA